MFAIYEDKYVLVDYIKLVQEDINDIMNNGYNVGFANDNMIVYLIKKSKGLYIIFFNKNDKNFSEYHYSERLIKGLFSHFKFRAIIGFKIKTDILNRQLVYGKDRLYLIHESLRNARCTLCDNTFCQNHLKYGLYLP